MSSAIAIPSDRTASLAALCRRYGVRRLQLFGSTARGKDRPDSDVDLLVDFLPQARKDFFTLGELSDELGQFFDGRVVDLVTEKAMNSDVREYVEPDLTLLYEG